MTHRFVKDFAVAFGCEAKREELPLNAHPVYRCTHTTLLEDAESRVKSEA